MPASAFPHKSRCFIRSCPATDVGQTVTADLARLLATQPAFDIQLLGTAWFADEVLWLASEDPQPIRALTELIIQAYPGFPSYGGEYAEPVPHLTVAHGCELSEMQAAETAVRDHLPIHAHIGAVTLLVQSEGTGTWWKLRKFPLGEASS